jgi:CheY-like chemotaxis protein
MTRILIVDDNAGNLYMLRALLQGHGCVVDEARHGAAALISARQNLPDLVISDLLMPVLDGYTLLRHWRADLQLRSVPFIVYTATYTQSRDERLAWALGADAFIIKPAEPEALWSRFASCSPSAIWEGCRHGSCRSIRSSCSTNTTKC